MYFPPEKLACTVLRKKTSCRPKKDIMYVLKYLRMYISFRKTSRYMVHIYSHYSSRDCAYTAIIMWLHVLLIRSTVHFMFSSFCSSLLITNCTFIYTNTECTSKSACVYNHQLHLYLYKHKLHRTRACMLLTLFFLFKTCNILILLWFDMI